MNWKALIGAMPDGTYTQIQVEQFDNAGMCRGGSSSESLLKDMGHKCKTVKQLITYLESIGHTVALELVKPDGSRPPRLIEHPISAVVPVGQDFTLSCRVEKPDDCNYQWFKDTFKLGDKCSPDIKFCPFNFEDEGNYTCRAYNTKGDALTRLATLQASKDKVALVIGNRDYINLPQHESPLVHTCGDAQSLASILRKNVMNFKVISLVKTVTSNGYPMKTYQHPSDAQSVLGFATCPGAEAYERKDDANGLYMKHLLPNITKMKKIEDMLQDVAADVEEEVASDPDVWRMRPQYHSKTVRHYSLCDPIVGDQLSQLRNEKWLDIHRLPQKHIFSHLGIKVEIRYEHSNWLSNVILVCLRVLDLGEATMCDASLVLNALPKDFQECHFHPSTTNKMRHVVPPENVGVAARAWKGEDEGPSQRPAPLPVERISDIYNIQRLKKNLALTIELKYTLRGSLEEQTKYVCKAFNLKEFGIVNAFEGS
ncbi:hypothetical protein QZH41_018132 [Actinostola sp. cb2023]|nr:hypothetical protein QZH41_018132 [Actinostola sp. cb2023]